LAFFLLSQVCYGAMSTQEVPSNANEGCVGPESEQAGKASNCAGCPNQSACASGQNKATNNPVMKEVADRMTDVKHIILVLSGKGGVGKSTVSSQLAWALAGMNFQVGILDIDICGPSVPRMMGVEGEEVRRSNFGWSPVYAADNLAVMSVAFMINSRNDAIVWRGPRKEGLIKQFLTDVNWGELDFLIVDAPPGTSDEHIAITQYLKRSNLEGALIVTTPQEVALLDVRKEISFCHKASVPVLGVVENMAGFVCPCCKHTSDIFPAVSGGAKTMAEEMKLPLLASLPIDPQMLRCCEKGESYLSVHPQGAAAEAFKGLVQSVLKSTPSLAQTLAERTASAADTQPSQQQEAPTAAPGTTAN